MKRFKTQKRSAHLIVLMALVFVIAACGHIRDVDQDLLDYLNIRDYLSEKNIDAEEHPSGLQFVIDQRGSGISPVPGDSIIVLYTISHLDGRLIDTTNEELAKLNGIYSPSDHYGPIAFVLYRNQLIEGFEIAAELLTEQGSGVFYLPSKLGYGASRFGEIEPYSNLILEMELLEVRH